MFWIPQQILRHLGRHDGTADTETERRHSYGVRWSELAALSHALYDQPAGTSPSPLPLRLDYLRGNYNIQVVSYEGEDGRKHRMWVFVMVLGFSRAIYVEFVRRADVPTFIRCHLNAFDYFGGVPRLCLYDNAKVVVMERDDEDGDHEWNSRMLDFARRVGFELRLCKPYRAQTKGKVENGVKYVKGNFWPSARFTDDADLNRQALAWCGEIANERVHGTNGRVPKAMLGIERSSLGALPERSTLGVYLREDRKVGRDGYVSWDRSRYGVPWSWSGSTVQVGVNAGMVEIWSGNERLAVHPRAHRRGQRLTLPGQWDGLVNGETRPKREALAARCRRSRWSVARWTSMSLWPVEVCDDRSGTGTPAPGDTGYDAGYGGAGQQAGRRCQEAAAVPRDARRPPGS